MLYCKQDNIIQKKEMTLLVVEDSEFINKSITALLLQTNQEYSIDQAFDFAQTVQWLQKNRYDYLLLDLNLPDAYGEELVTDILNITNAKIIVLTSEIDIQIRESLFKKGILDYLVKEKDFNSVVRSINNTIEILEKNRESTILVIDDLMFMRKQLQKILEVRNYNVLLAENAADALEKLENSMINAIVLDMELPDMHGLELLAKMKEIDEYCHIPVLIVSATNDPEIVRKALKTGALDFINKPFNIEEFTLKIDLSVEANRKYVESLCSQKMLSEYKEAIDANSYVTKTDLNGIITYANELFCDLSGYTEKELVGSSHSIVRHPDVPSSVFKGMWKTIQEKKIWRGILKNRKKNAEAYYVKSMVKPILDVNGNIIEYIAIRTDITELESYKQLLEENLNISNNNLRYLQQYENAIDEFVAVIKTNNSGVITYVNENFLELSGYLENDLLGKKCSMLRAANHIRQGDCDTIAQKLVNKEKVSILFENIAKNGTSYYVDTKIYPFIDEKNNIQEYLHLMYDVTEIVNLHEELENTQKEIIYTMGEVGESRSQETGNHVKRVAEYSRLLAHLVGLGEKNANLLYSASPMHDIGKVGIPDSILKKPGKLTDEEWQVMREHSEIGFNILKNSKRSILKTAAIVSYMHHEKWDGSGYPQGISGESIHIFGRITAIADVFDALGSDRCYKKAWELDKIIALFKAEKGKHFDPKLVDLFLDNLDDFLVIRDKFK